MTKPTGYFWIMIFMALASLAFVQAKVRADEGRVAAPVEDFKGQPRGEMLSFGGLVGLGVFESSGGLALIGSAAKNILATGFISEINDEAFVELQLGPVFLAAGTAVFYSAHLRWDFHMNPQWTFYALGGFGGNASGAALGNRWTLLPRFGVGAVYQVHPAFAVRGELSHELIAVGVSWGI